MSDLDGQCIIGFKLEKRIGTGAYGEVYLGQKDGSKFAIKLLQPHLRSSQAQCEAFARGWEETGVVTHENLVTTFGCALDPNYGTILIEDYFRSKSLRSIVYGGTRLHWKDIVELALDICKGLKPLHDQKLAHGDLWPSNILIDLDQVVRLEGAGALTYLKTPLYELIQWPAWSYQAPERLAGQPPSAQADLYALGTSMIFALTHNDPFERVEPQYLMNPTRTLPDLSKVVPELPHDLARVLHMLLAFDSALRYDAVESLVSDLEAVKKGIPISFKPKIASTPQPMTELELPASKPTAKMLEPAKGSVSSRATTPVDPTAKLVWNRTTTSNPKLTPQPSMVNPKAVANKSGQIDKLLLFGMVAAVALTLFILILVVLKATPTKTGEDDPSPHVPLQSPSASD